MGQLEYEMLTKRHLIITGIGRSGTTLLVQYLTAIGLDTGFTKDNMFEVDPISHAGLEYQDLCQENVPYVVKAPSLCDTLDTFLESKCANIDLAIVPVRKLADAANSRVKVYNQALQEGLDPIAHPGSIWGESDCDNQESTLALKFYSLIFTLIKHEIKTYFLEFPRFAYDHDYLYKSLEPILLNKGVTYNESVKAHSEVVNCSLISKSD